MILNNNNDIKCRKCDRRFKCLTASKEAKQVVCPKTGERISIKQGSFELWGNDENYT